MIGLSDGQISAKMKLDHEAKSTMMVTVKATDPNGLSDSVDVTIKVTGVDEAPMIAVGGLAISGTTRVDYAEDGRDAVATYVASGPDADMATWSLEGDDAADFRITSTGVLTFVRAPDYENPADADGDNVYMVTVNADDGTYTDAQDVTVTVTNVDELGTLTGNPSVSYMENGMGAVETYSADAATWSLEGDDDGDFSINGGELTFRSSPDFENPADADTDNVYEVTVKAAAGGEMDMVAVTVIVTNVDEDGAVTLSSTRPVVGTELTASVDDPDGSVAGTTWQWASSSDGMEDGTWADIDGATNAAYTPVDADDTMFLQAAASYTDGEGSGKSAKMATANAVTSNSPPAFPDTEDGMRSVAENTAAGENVGTPVAATDPNAGDTLVYTLGGADAASFAIDTNGQITVGAGTMLDAEGTQTTYMVTVTASDGVASDSIDVTITVENAPLAGVGDTYDANNNEMIERSEAIAAVRAYFRGEITKEQTIMVIGLYL